MVTLDSAKVVQVISSIISNLIGCVMASLVVLFRHW